jgi:general secretion pathway protein D
MAFTRTPKKVENLTCRWRYPRQWVILLCVALLTSGCAGWQSFRQGKSLIEAGVYDEGFKKIDEAIAADPRNTEYKIYAASRRMAMINGLLARAESARGLGRTTEAEAFYKQVLSIDEKNQMAVVGLRAMEIEARHQRMMAQAEQQFKDGKIREAEEIVRAVIAENPNQRDANALRQRINEKIASQPKVAPRLAEAFRKPVSLDFRDAQLKSVFDVLARASGLNFVFDKDIKVDTKVTIVARETSVEEALRLLALTQQIEQRPLNDNSVLIYPNTPQKARDYQPLVVRSFYLAHADVKQVANTLRTILKARDVVVNEKLNLLIVRDTQESVRLAEKLIALEDIGESEVMLEVEVLEIKRTRLTDLGVRWPDQFSLGVTRTTGSPLSLYDILNFDSRRRNEFFGTIDITASAASNPLINSKSEAGDTNILANPRIRVRNKEKAKIHIGDRVPVITTTSTSTGFVSDSVTYVDVGLKLDVEPTVFLDDEVAIKLSLEVGSIVREVQTRSGTLSYQIGTRNTSTALKLRDGETQVLAGLISDEDRATANRIPGIGQFPILSRVFGTQRDDTLKTEIVLSITPRLLRSVRRPDLVSAEFDSGTEASLGARAGVTSSGTTTSPQTTPAPSTAPPSRPSSSPDRLPPSAPPPPVSGSVSPSATAPLLPAPPSSSQTPVQSQATPGVTSTGESGDARNPTAPAGGAFRAAWRGPSEARVGDNVSLTLNVDSAAQVSSIPLLIGFDPADLEITGASEGDFLRQGGATQFRPQIDQSAGRAFVEIARTSGAAQGSGSVLNVSFRALRAKEVSVRLLAITPNPAPTGGVGTLPVEHRLMVR